MLCKALGVSESGYHAWKGRPESKRSKQDRTLKLHVKAEYERSRKTYGSPRIKLELDSAGIPIGKHRAARLMKEAGIKARKPRKFKVTTDSSHKLDRAPNLVNRRFSELASAPNRLWVSDLTYVWTHQGWLYLCVFIDVYSRKVVGYSIDDTMETKMVNDALSMAFRRRQIKEGLIIHSDQGVQYASSEFKAMLKTFHVVQSMSRKGDCWDNAVAESFFATVKGELIDRQSWASKAHARLAIVEWIECFYNNQRRHTSIGGVCPVEYESLTRTTQAA
jgi:transposase InsO family protein